MMKLTKLLAILVCASSAAYGETEQDNQYHYLDNLALQAGTDKSSAFHNYTEIYSQYFSHLIDKPIKFLEIGIYKGDSVKLWESYFPNADLHFIDINANQIKYVSNRSHYHFVDQTDSSGLICLAQSLGGEFDIIIDDGGHTMDQQITSLKALIPFIKKGGMYIIEDLHTSYWTTYGGNGSTTSPKAGPGTTVYFLQSLIDELNYTGARTQCADRKKVPNTIKTNFYQDQIYSIHFYKSLCIIKRN